MRSMTGYGRGQSVHNGSKFSVELNSVNRKQSDVVVTLPRELTELEPRVRDLINAAVSRGRLNVVIACHQSTSSTQNLALDANLARIYYRAMLDLQKELKAAGEINIETVLRAPGVLRLPEEQLSDRRGLAGTSRPLAQGSAGRSGEDARTRRQAPGQGFDSPAQGRARLRAAVSASFNPASSSGTANRCTNASNARASSCR